ncbi:MAG: hypothetical protein ACYC3S_01530 [Chloroflexota bacterium]
MGNRDKGNREVRKPKKKDPREVKSLSTSALAQPSPVPEVVRKKKREEPEEADR